MNRVLKQPKQLFRQEAVLHHASGSRDGGIVQTNERWFGVAHQLLGVAFLAIMLFCSLISVDEYATGPAVVRIDGRRVETAHASGSVSDVAVRPGQAVDVGAVLVTLNDFEERSELARATAEYERELSRFLLDPGDANAKQSLPTLRARRDQAMNTFDARRIRAHTSGIVSDVRAHPGQHVAQGDVLCAIVPAKPGSGGISVVAMLPAEYRPMLRSNQRMRFELDGFQYSYTDVAVEEVSAEAIGSAEVQRFLSTERRDTVRLDEGGKVLVTARLPASTFSSNGHSYGYYDGLTGIAAVSVRREPIIVTLLPVLRKFSSR